MRVLIAGIEHDARRMVLPFLADARRYREQGEEAWMIHRALNSAHANLSALLRIAQYRRER